MLPQPRSTPTVSYPNKAPNYARIMSQSKATTSYAQLVPQKQTHAPTWPTQQYVGKMPTFVASPSPQIYYASPVQATQTPALAPPAPLGQVFAHQNRPNQLAPNNEQGKAINNWFRNQGNNQPQGGGQQPNPPNNAAVNRPAQNPCHIPQFCKIM